MSTPIVTKGKESIIEFPIDADNRMLVFVKRPTGWWGIEAYTLQSNDFTIIDMDDDLAEALDKIVAKS